MVSPIRPAHCPPLEEIAALIDGRLSGADRARVVAHVADCADCYAVLAGTVDFLDHENEAGAEDEAEGHPSKSHAALVLLSPPPETDELPPTESILPVRPGNPGTKKFRDWGWMLRLAAAVVVGVGAGWLVASMGRMPSGSAEEWLAQDLQGKAKPYAKKVNRSAASDQPARGIEVSFLAGVKTLDLELLTTQKRASAAESIFAELQELESGELREGSSPSSLAAVREIETKLSDLYEELDEGSNYEFGKWAEAGRFAAQAANREHFTRGSLSRQFLTWMLKQEEDSDLYLLEGTREDLMRVSNLVQSESLSDENFKALTPIFTAIIDRYELYDGI